MELHALTETSPPESLAFKAFAAHLGCRPSYITELRKSGRLVLTEDGRAVRVAESLARIEATRDPARAGVVDRHAAQRGSALTAPAAPSPSPRAEEGTGAPADDDSDNNNPDYQRWKARRERAAALREEMRLGEEAKDYIRRADAAAVVAAAFVMLRTALEMLPDSLAAVLAAENDEVRARVLLAEEVESILGNCAAGLRTITHGEA